MLWYEELLAREEEFRKTEQSLLLSALLSNPGRGTLSILRRAGLAMTGMEVEGRSCGAGGRIVLEMVSGISGTKNNSSSSNNTNNESDSSTVNCFKPGELVKLIVNGQLLKCTGTIERSRPQSNLQCRVSLSDTIDDEEMEMIMNGRVAVIKIVDETGGFDKMKRNLEFIEKEAEGEGELIRDVREFIKMIEKSGIKKSELEPECAEPIDNSTDSHKEALNFEQGLAVEEALGMLNDPSRNLLLIHGPPGTGKTSTLLEIIKQIKLTKNSLKILICGPSNLSVDNIVEGLLRVKGFETEGGKLLRVGHPSRVLESCQGTTLDFWSEHSDAGKLLKDVQREIDEIVKNQLPRCKSREERRELYGELKLLRQERRKREKSLQVELLKRADIVVCTLSTASGKKIFNLDKFDLAILDEAGQSLLPESLVAPLLAKKLIMAGDHCQLPPTVMNPEIKNQLEVSLFELFIRGKKGKSVMLREQYRMNELIMKWSNEVFYGNNLRAHETVRNWTLTEQSDVLVFYDTCGFDLWESEEKSKGNGNGKSLLIEEMSKFNLGEVRVVKAHLKKLIDSGVKPERIAIISPYSAQVSLLRESIDPTNGDVEINSIDAFQGREKDAVIISMVRSNSDGIVGFLGEMRRINVAMTRARKQLVIIGDSDTLSRDEKLKGLVKIKCNSYEEKNSYSLD